MTQINPHDWNAFGSDQALKAHIYNLARKIAAALQVTDFPSLCRGPSASNMFGRTSLKRSGLSP
jgi:hypothetical protein